MKHAHVLSLTALLLTGAGFLSTATATDFYVAPKGDDTNTGTKDKPFAKLEAARDAARKAGAGSHRIILTTGDHFLSKTLELDARDNGLTIQASDAGKVTVYGGSLVTGWRRDGEKFWCADLPDVKAGKWDFRALVVNGRMPERSRLPETGTLLHKSVFDVRWLSSVGGGWERKPTQEELTTMIYDPKDIPAMLEPRNAEVRVYHMWDESLCGVARNDTDRHALLLTPAAKSPPGAFGVKKYAVFNTREGMTQPGQWYLDRAAGRVVYWPLPGEDMTKAKVVAPRLERMIRIAGNAKQPVEKITLRGLAIQATTTPLKSGGFGAYAFEGALSVERARQCVFEKLEVCNVGGQGIVARLVTDCRISDSHIHHIGACGIKAEGSTTLIASNHVHHVGLYYPSAVALSVSTRGWDKGEKGFQVCRNEVHDAPYSGMIGSGGGHVFEENLIYRVMRELQDGAAIYGSMSRCILRGNIVRDVVKMGEGYGISSYYLDEGARDCVIERNVSVGVERPIHNHIARNTMIRDNVFIATTNMTLSLARSGDITFQGNTLFAPGELLVTPPSAVKLWTNNVVFRSGVDKTGAPQAFTITSAMPPAKAPARRTYSVAVERVAQPPVLDGEIGWDEWPHALLHLEREPSRWSASGAPVYAKLAYDDQCLYVAVNVVFFDITKLSKGSKWGKDDGAEVCIAGKTPDGKPVNFVVHGFAGGTFESVTLAGAPADAAERLGKAVRFCAKPYGKTKGDWKSGCRYEWAIPWDAIGLKPAPKQKIAFNLGTFRAEDSVWRCYEGTLRQNWRLDQAGTMQLK
ncbi:MAG: right-handed parallel beta-helix repeat-containing protein [Verrucomicrobiia bacterium]